MIFFKNSPGKAPSNLGSSLFPQNYDTRTCQDVTLPAKLFLEAQQYFGHT